MHMELQRRLDEGLINIVSKPTLPRDASHARECILDPTLRLASCPMMMMMVPGELRGRASKRDA